MLQLKIVHFCSCLGDQIFLLYTIKYLGFVLAVPLLYV